MALVKGALAISWVVFRSAPIQARHPGSGREKRLEEEVAGAQTSSDRIDKDERIQPVRPNQIFGVGHAIERVVMYHSPCLCEDGQKHRRAPLIVLVP